MGHVAGELAGHETLDDARQLVAQKDGHDGRRRLVRPEAMVVAAGCRRHAQQVLVIVDRLDNAGQDDSELQVVLGRIARVEEILGFGPERPVVMLARSVDALEGLLVLEADEVVVRCEQAHLLHREQVLVDRAVHVAEHGREFVLGGSDLVVLGLRSDGEPPEHVVELLHEGVDRRADGAEIMLVELLPFAGRRPEERAAAHDEVLAFGIDLLGYEEVFLFVADVDLDARRMLAEEREHALGLLFDGRDGTQKRRLLVERFAVVRTERRRDAEDLVLDEGVARRIPSGIAAGFEGRAQAARREARSVGLALDELLAGELRDGRAVMAGLEEGVVLFGRDARQRLEPMGVMRGTVAQGPFLHAVGNGVRDLEVERFPLLDRQIKLRIRIRRKVFAHHLVGKDRRAVAL